MDLDVELSGVTKLEVIVQSKDGEQTKETVSNSLYKVL